MTTTTMPKLDEALEKKAEKQKALAAILAEAGPEMDMSKVTTLTGDTKAKVEEIRRMNAELDEIGVEVDDLREVKKAADRVAAAEAAGDEGGESGDGATKGGEREDTKTLGDVFLDSEAFKGKTGDIGPSVHVDFDTKVLFQTTDGFPPETTRTGRMVDFATRPLQVAELIPQVPTSQSAVVYMEETVFVNNAQETAEGGTYQEAELQYEEKSSPVRKIAVFLPVTDEQLEDAPSMRARINNRLPFMVRQRLDSQILVGDGVAPNLDSIVRTGSQTQALGADPVPDAIYKGMTKIETGAFSFPDLVVLHPNDWQGIRLLRTTDGIYIWGSPADAGPERIWGTRVAKAHAQTEGTGLVLDTSQLELSVRRGMDVQISNSHADFFVNGKQAIRADIRVALQVYRPAAVCTVTGI